jgi:hypothetical protein
MDRAPNPNPTRPRGGVFSGPRTRKNLARARVRSPKPALNPKPNPKFSGPKKRVRGVFGAGLGPVSFWVDFRARCHPFFRLFLRIPQYKNRRKKALGTAQKFFDRMNENTASRDRGVALFSKRVMMPPVLDCYTVI